MDAADSIRKLHFLSSVHLGDSSLLVGGPSSSTGFVVSAAHRSAEQSRQAAKVSLLWCKETGPLGCVFVCQCLNWVLVRRRSDRLTAAIALIISRRPITDDLSIGSPIKIAELTNPIAGTESKLNEVVIAGKVRATVTNAQKGNAVINGPL
jgi:hypothetical protein